MIRIALILSLIGCVSRVQAADAGTTSANFLKLGAGARAVAMGEAQVGLADDVFATYWNPAGLAQLKVQEAGFTQTQYFQDFQSQYAAYAYPHAKLGTFAGSFTYLNVGKFQGYDAAGQPMGSIGANDAALALSYARPLHKDQRLGSLLSAGLTAKWIQERLDNVSAQAFATDAGVLWEPGRGWISALRGWRMGLALRNLGTALQFDRESFALPRSLNVGVSYTGPFLGESMTLALDGQHPNDGERSLRMGIEVWTFQALVLRAGYTTLGDVGSGWRAGAGLRFRTLQLDYAFAGAGDVGNAHRIGLTFRFHKPKEDPVVLAQDWYERGMRDFRKERYTDALINFNKTLEIDPSHPQAFEMMNRTHEKLKASLPQ